MIFSITNILFFWPLMVNILRLVVRFAFLVIFVFVFVPSILYFYYDGFTQVESKLEHQVCSLDRDRSQNCCGFKPAESGAQDRPCSKRQESPSQWAEFFVSIDGFLHIEVTEKKSLCERNFPVGLSTEKTIWELQISLFASQDISGVVANTQNAVGLYPYRLRKKIVDTDAWGKRDWHHHRNDTQGTFRCPQGLRCMSARGYHLAVIATWWRQGWKIWWWNATWSIATA